ncbi:MAG: hypothetical protein IPK74_01505 [Deltaproteobacteria bacterium]|nr:hypothetical protein [Deltaproteobacteria bacterium]
MPNRSVPIRVLSLAIALCSTASGCADPDESLDGELDEDDNEPPGDEVSATPSVSPASANTCIGKAFFAGECRSLSWFERFLSPGASIGGVLGSTSKLHDDGVVVIEEFSDSFIQLIRITPDAQQVGHALSPSLEYRGGYTVVARETLSMWVGGDEQSNYLVTEFGSRSPAITLDGASDLGSFGILSWLHHVSTPSGWREIDSEGWTRSAIAASGVEACQAQADVTGNALAAQCTISGLAVGFIAGTLVGTEIYAASTASSSGAAAVASLAPSIGTGTAVASYVGISAANVCRVLGETLKSRLRRECLYPPNNTSEAEIRPVETADIDDFSEGECGPGMVSYTGEALYCTDEDECTFVDDEVTVTNELTCREITVQGECVPTEVFA